MSEQKEDMNLDIALSQRFHPPMVVYVTMTKCVFVCVCACWYVGAN